MSNEITLRVGGAELGGWTSVSVARDLERIAGSFALTMAEVSPEDPRWRPLCMGDECEVAVGGERVLQGYVTSITPSYAGSSHSIGVRGFDATNDLVESSALHCSGVWESAPLERIAADLCEPFGIEVSVDVDTGAPFRQFKLAPGESVYEALERGARYRGVLLVSDGGGGLRITLPGLRLAHREIRRGDADLLSGRLTASDHDRFSEIRVQGQRDSRFSAFWDPPGAGTPVEGRATDPHMRRYRPLTLLAEDPGDPAAMAARAQREVNLRAARARKASYELEGWREESELWQVGDLVSVSDSWLGIDRSLLLVTATFSLDAGGRRVQLDLMRPEAFDLRVLPEPAEEAPGAEFWERSA